MRTSLIVALLLTHCPSAPIVAKFITLAKPAILFADVTAGPISGGPDNQGVPITIFGKGFGAQRDASTVTINGVEVARYLSWGENNANNPMLDMIVIQPGPAITAGPIVVHVNGHASKAAATSPA